MEQPLYTHKNEFDTEMGNLGYNASVHDLVVQAAHTELNRYFKDEQEAVRLWGWDPGSLHDADRYRIVQLLRSFVYQERLIVTALDWLDEKFGDYLRSSPEARRQAEAFVSSLNLAAARRAVDYALRALPGVPTDWIKNDKREQMAKDVLAKWQQKAPETDAHAPGTRDMMSGFHKERNAFDRYHDAQKVLEQGQGLVGAAIMGRLKGMPGLGGLAHYLVKESSLDRGSYSEAEQFADSVGEYLPPAFRRIHALRSIIDFHDPEIARTLGRRGDYFSSRPWDPEEMKKPDDTTFKGSGFGMELWRLKDQGYPRERIPDGLLYDLVDTALAVQAEYQLQCFFVDRELAKIIDTRGKDEQWLYEKTAEAAVERARARAEAAGFWGLVGDILGLVSAVAWPSSRRSPPSWAPSRSSPLSAPWARTRRPPASRATGTPPRSAVSRRTCWPPSRSWAPWPRAPRARGPRPA
ncbi:hypothetical protein [Streptomyces nondiastaticus]|uniref:Uncharacterized protein n=1 Tax=Streptomyces nondiastaticus TaxID=3154512 RepID=A0ABW6U8M6_9ACTN